jgi:hypothetical protein
MRPVSYVNGETNAVVSAFMILPTMQIILPVT